MCVCVCARVCVRACVLCHVYVCGGDIVSERVSPRNLTSLVEREGEWGRERPRQTDRLETDRHRQTNRDTHRGRYFASQDVSRGVLLSHPKCSVELGGATKASIVYKMQPKTCLSNVSQIVMFALGCQLFPV